ncbi:MAG: aminotransferase class III-fold pyridoxal phosphate-dependent enzyme [Akkermansiaceae bacterium]|nr:aminotransferase class III-fold pyridoxal phosphate-dependent enzyme [Akkermansiaceae bacterium]
MAITLVTELTEADARLAREATEGFVPEAVYDIHTHLFHSAHFAEGKSPEFLAPDTGYGFADYRAALGRWLPGREVDGLFFGYPAAGNDRAGENDWVASQLARHPERRLSRGLALVAPEDGEEATRRLIASRGFVGIKPYRLYAPVADTTQARIEEFAPRWMWEVCHDIDGVLMLHIMRSEGIADPDNLEAIARLSREYPRCRLVLAHVARSFNYRNARAALRTLEPLDNVVVDTSAVTEAEAMRVALEALGPRRVLFGSDYMVSEFRGKCFTMGDGFSWLYADKLPTPAVTVFENYALVGVESVLCLREAFEIGGFNAADARDVFRDNALRLLAPHLDAADVPALPEGTDLWRRAREVISCGTGLLSKRAESFDPVTWPSYFSRASGSHLWDTRGRRLVDFTGGVGAILLGHSDPEVNAAVRRRTTLGTYATLASPDEIELAELLLELHPWAGKVRYARGGGEALGVAARIARAATGRSGIVFCGYHGWSDWYLAANLGDTDALDGHLLPGLEPHGVPRELAGTAAPFRYNDLGAFETAIAAVGGAPAAVMMEPFRSEMPRDGFLEKIAAHCREIGTVLVVDEVTAGWRFGFPGGCARVGIQPDLAIYAKAMSNGVPCAAVVGRDSVMDAANESFISSSYWTDGIGPAAALACIGKMKREGTQAHVWALGERLQAGLRDLATKHGALAITIAGQPCAPSLAFGLGEEAMPAKVLMIRGMLRRGFLFSSQLYAMGTHDLGQVESMLDALDETLGEVDRVRAEGRLRDVAGAGEAKAGFARLA